MSSAVRSECNGQIDPTVKGHNSIKELSVATSHKPTSLSKSGQFPRTLFLGSLVRSVRRSTTPPSASRVGTRCGSKKAVVRCRDHHHVQSGRRQQAAENDNR